MLTQRNTKTLNLACIGLGWIGRNRMEVLLKSGSADVVAIVEPIKENAQQAIALAPNAKIISSGSEACSLEDVEGVVIATPSGMHAEQALHALKAGKSVFCQKPLGRSAHEVKEIVKASRQADKLLAMDVSYRYTEAFQKMLEVVQSGDIGNVIGVNLVFHNAYGPDKAWARDYNLSGGGCVIDLGIHLIDMAMLCLDFPEIKDITSTMFSKGVKLNPGEEKVEDFAKIHLITTNDVPITLDCSWHASVGKDAVIEVSLYGTCGSVSFKNMEGSFYDFKAEKYSGTSTTLLPFYPQVQ